MPPRTQNINRQTKIKYANRTGNKIADDYLTEKHEYGEIKEMCVMLLPFGTAVQAESFGVSFLGGRKATLTKQQALEFDEFTHIWIDSEPDQDKQNPNYYVKQANAFINDGYLVIDKIAGR